MAAPPKEKHNFPVLVDGFMSVSDDAFCDEPELRWYCAPDCWQDDSSRREHDDSKGELREGKDGSWLVDGKGQLVVKPPAKKDFWRKTYYDPVMAKDDGPCLFATVPVNKAIMAETCFTIDTQGTPSQFDQAGILVRIDSEHWLKTGIEIVDGIPRLSCVCTNVYSDWSTQNYWKPKAEQVRIRVHILPNKSIVVEAWDDTDTDTTGGTWNFIRIAHLSPNTKCDPDPLQDHPNVTKAWTGKAAPENHLYVGVFACCPVDQVGTTVTFHDFSVVAGSNFTHNADDNAE